MVKEKYAVVTMCTTNEITQGILLIKAFETRPWNVI